MEEKSLILFQHCSKHFGKKDILKDISFSVEKSCSFISLLGKSGSGKTTLARLFAGLEVLTTGRIYIDGEIVSDGKTLVVMPYQRNIGFIFQDLALFPHLTVFENIAFGLKIKKVRDFNLIVEDALQKFSLESYGMNYPNQLSGGQQQLVALARSLVLSPRILVMDEPLANLDVKLKTQIRNHLRKIIKEKMITILYITHDHKEAMEMSDKILLLNEGRMDFFGTPEEMIRSNNIFVNEFIEL